MSPSPNRRRLVCQPLDGPFAASLMMGMPKALEPLALLVGAGKLPDGVLVRSKRTGILQRYSLGALSVVDPRKAEAALAEMAGAPIPPPKEEETAAELATLLRDSRDQAGLSTEAMGEILGLSKRTIEGIEQGRGFGHPRLLTLALLALE